MHSIMQWSFKAQDQNKNGISIQDLCFNIDGSQLIVATANHIQVYSTIDGTLIQTLKGHKDKVYCLSYARNGKRFASGGADKCVIIWSYKLEGLLKYSHNEAIQCIAFNPQLLNLLVSCAVTDFGFWTSEQKSVQKQKTIAKINSCSWTPDGEHLAFGLNNGMISIRNRSGDERHRINSNTSTPAAIWALMWCPNVAETGDILCVTDWAKNLTFYDINGSMVGKQRFIDFEALKVCYFNKGEYILIGGLNRCCIMYTKDGIRLDMIGPEQQSWIWSCAAHPSDKFVATGCEDGTLSYYQLVFSTVHSLYNERYAFRENLTDVIIQHMITEQKVRIKCKSLVKKIAIFKHRLAVQLLERVVIYELYSNDANDMHYRVKEKISRQIECSLLVVCTEHLVICQDKKLQSIYFSGANDKEWAFPSTIKYIKAVGGTLGKEGMLLGLKNGQVWQVHLHSTKAVLRVVVTDGIRCLDLSQKQTKLAVVEDSGLLTVFHTTTNDLYFQEPEANSVAFNSLYEDMIAFSSASTLSLKVLDFPAHTQPFTGCVVGLSGAKVFCLVGSTMVTKELSMGPPMRHFLDKRLFSEAYKIACLGVSNAEWEDLGYAALENLELEIARLAYIRLQNMQYLELIKNFEEQQKRGELNKDSMIGDLLACKGQFKEAANMYRKAGQDFKALNMYTDLRMFDMAQEFLGSAIDNVNLIRQKAQWAQTINEHKAAADLYLSISDYEAAIEIFAQKEWIDDLLELRRKLDKSDKDTLLLIANHLKKLRHPELAIEIYKYLGDHLSMLNLYIEMNNWEAAFQLVETHSQYRTHLYVPYAYWLIESERFIEAQRVFHEAGCSGESFRVVQQLIENGLVQNRYHDVSYYHWILSKQYLDTADSKKNNVEECLAEYASNERLAVIYYCYHWIYHYLEEPFTAHSDEGLFNISKFLLNEINNKRPRGVSLFYILFCLSKQSKKLGAHKFARSLYDRLRTLRIPTKYQEQIEISELDSKACDYSDPEDLMTMCYRCSTSNSLSTTSNKCTQCGEPFVHSFVSFEVLPLVQFELEDGIDDVEALRLIERPFESQVKDVEHISQEVQMLTLSQVDDNHDEFYKKLVTQRTNATSGPIKVNEDMLLKMDASSILIAKRPSPLRYQFYKNIITDLKVTICQSCYKAFYMDDFEMELLQRGCCPFCRTSVRTESTEVNKSGDAETSYFPF